MHTSNWLNERIFVHYKFLSRDWVWCTGCWKPRLGNAKWGRKSRTEAWDWRCSFSFFLLQSSLILLTSSPLFCVSPVRPFHSVSASWCQSSFRYLLHGLLCDRLLCCLVSFVKTLMCHSSHRVGFDNLHLAFFDPQQSSYYYCQQIMTNSRNITST